MQVHECPASGASKWRFVFGGVIIALAIAYLGPRFGAILSVCGLVNVTVVFLAIRLWRTINPVLIFRDGGLTMDSAMQLSLGASLVTVTLLYLCLLTMCVRAERLWRTMERLKLLQSSACV